MTSTQEFSVNTGVALLSTGNAYLDGSGSIELLLTGALPVGTSTGGTTIKSVTIKATQAVTTGMIRFFLYDGTYYYLIKEIMVPCVTPSAILPAFSITTFLPVTLYPGYSLYASTQNSENFSVFVDALNWGSCDCVDDCGCETTPTLDSIAATTLISTGNSNLDGTGTLVNVFTASGTDNCGTMIRSIIIKAQQNTTQGMIRLFVNLDGTAYNNYLFYEIPVSPVTTNNGVLASFSANLPASFNLKTGASLRLSTENTETFSVTVNGMAFQTCGCKSE